MTKSKGIGRGGARPGAGRKPNPRPERPPLEVPLSADVADVIALAKSHTALAIAVLASIAKDGEKEASRVAAAKELIMIGHGRPAEASAPGKKATRQAAAEQASAQGRFAVPKPPKLVVDNG